MRTNNRIGMPSNFDGGEPPYRLPPHVEQRCREAADMDGNNIDLVEQVAVAAHNAEKGGVRTEAERRVENMRARKQRSENFYREAWSRLRHSERHIRTSVKRKIGAAGWGKILFSFGLLAFFIWIENGAAAQAALATGAFDLTTLDAARQFMLTPVLVGAVLALGIHRLPASLQNRGIYLALILLGIVFLVWALSLGAQAESFRQEATQSISLGEDHEQDGALMDASPEEQGGLSAWLMFCGLTITMSLTAFIGETTLEHIFRGFYFWEPNPEYTRALDDVHAYEHDIRRSESQIIEDEACLAQLAAEAQQHAAQARCLYKYLKQQAAGRLLLLFVMALTATGCTGLSGRPSTGDRDPWTTDKTTRPEVVTRVLAISPVLPSADEEIARQQLEEMLAWLAAEAPVGSVVVVVDALECVPIAKFEAIQGVARIRKKSFVKPAAAVRRFLDKPHPRIKDDGRINLPRLAQTARQWRLPAGSHVAVCGNPLFLNEGKDVYFSMAGGRVPSDGCLFEDPKLNIYSIVGREKSLSRTLWHMGWSDDGVFEDDHHRQAVLRFWFLYFQGQGAVLVTAQRSIPAAIEAAREAETEPFMFGDPDRTSAAAMVKTVKVVTESKKTIEPKKVDGAAVPKVVPPPAQASATMPPTPVRNAPVVEAEHDTRHARNPIETVTTIKQPSRDLHGNLFGETHDLISRGQMKGRKVLVVPFFHNAEVSASPLYKALRDKGYEVVELRPPLPPPEAFETMLDGVDQLWLLSSKDQLLPRTQLQTLARRWKEGRLALCLLADNAPFTTEAKAILDAVVPGCRIGGDYLGERKLTRRNGGGPGFDATCPLFHNVDLLYEGYTVSSVSGPGLTPVCYASNGLPLIATFEQPGSRRLLVHCGFTSLFPQYWDDAGVSRFAVNAAGWLSGADEGKSSTSVPNSGGRSGT